MIYLVQFILITFGITLTIVRAKPLKPLREFLTRKSLLVGQFLGCYQCVAFWVAPITYLLMSNTSLELIGYIFIGTGTSHILGTSCSKNI